MLPARPETRPCRGGATVRAAGAAARALAQVAERVVFVVHVRSPLDTYNTLLIHCVRVFSSLLVVLYCSCLLHDVRANILGLLSDCLVTYFLWIWAMFMDKIVSVALISLIFIQFWPHSWMKTVFRPYLDAKSF